MSIHRSSAFDTPSNQLDSEPDSSENVTLHPFHPVSKYSYHLDKLFPSIHATSPPVGTRIQIAHYKCEVLLLLFCLTRLHLILMLHSV